MMDGSAHEIARAQADVQILHTIVARCLGAIVAGPTGFAIVADDAFFVRLAFVVSGHGRSGNERKMCALGQLGKNEVIFFPSLVGRPKIYLGASAHGDVEPSHANPSHS